MLRPCNTEQPVASIKYELLRPKVLRLPSSVANYKGTKLFVMFLPRVLFYFNARFWTLDWLET